MIAFQGPLVAMETDFVSVASGDLQVPLAATSLCYRTFHAKIAKVRSTFACFTQLVAYPAKFKPETLSAITF